MVFDKEWKGFRKGKKVVLKVGLERNEKVLERKQQHGFKRVWSLMRNEKISERKRKKVV